MQMFSVERIKGLLVVFLICLLIGCGSGGGDTVQTGNVNPQNVSVQNVSSQNGNAQITGIVDGSSLVITTTAQMAGASVQLVQYI